MADLKSVFKDVPAGHSFYGVAGWPLSHTLSPAMHNAAILALGINAAYKAIPVSPENWDDFLLQAADFPLQGFNVTVPHKEKAWKIQGEGAPFLSLAGAVNTLKRSKTGWEKFNTDGLGFLQDLRAREIPVEGQKIVLLGAGGSARTLLAALVQENLNPSSVGVINRHPERGRILIDSLLSQAKPNFPIKNLASNSEQRSAVEEADLLVNCTSLGLNPGGPSVVSKDWLHSKQTVYDLIYHRTTELMEAAAEKGARAVGGLGMLVGQGAKAFEIWFNQKPPVEIMRQAAEDELKKRREA